MLPQGVCCCQKQRVFSRLRLLCHSSELQHRINQPENTHVAQIGGGTQAVKGDQSGPGANDSLSFNGLNVINPAIAPRARRVLVVFSFDANSDGVTDTSQSLQPFGSISFLTGVDDYLPASPAGTGTIAVQETMRATGHVETINVPNWPSSEGVTSMLFRDYVAKKYKKPNKKK